MATQSKSGRPRLAVEISETYTDYVLDGKVDAKLFEALK